MAKSEAVPEATDLLSDSEGTRYLCIPYDLDYPGAFGSEEDALGSLVAYRAGARTYVAARIVGIRHWSESDRSYYVTEVDGPEEAKSQRVSELEQLTITDELLSEYESLNAVLGEACFRPDVDAVDEWAEFSEESYCWNGRQS